MSSPKTSALIAVEAPEHLDILNKLPVLRQLSNFKLLGNEDLVSLGNKEKLTPLFQLLVARL
jgi:hypothetical protein